MRIARFETLARHVHSDRELSQTCERVTLFRRFQDEWFEDSGQLLHDTGEIELLEHAKREGKPWRERSSRDAYFPLEPLDLVLKARFSKSPRGTTMSRVAQAFRNCATHSENEFNAKHHPLTGLLNREGIDDAVTTWTRHDAVSGNSDVTEEIASTVTSGLLVFALDVDRFKQVNDSYGHDYGDAVLWVVGRRLDLEAKAMEKALGCPSVAAHPSGEEFFVFANARLPKTSLMEQAERLRKAISDAALPSEEEWADWLAFRESTASLPEHAARHVTVSIGVSSSARLAPNTLDQLKREADIALYRAKASGRNRACYFPDIRIQHGRVLEHHASTDTVAIDIGRTVGVRPGAEFLVYHPDFVGKQPFKVSDGRTTRQLGEYPRVHHGRLIAFHVQEELTFCEIARSDFAGHIPDGAHLELVPTGTISHLVEHRFRLSEASEMRDSKAIASIVSEHAKAGAPGVVVFALRNADALESVGGFRVNEALADLYNAMKSKASGSAIGQISSSQLTAVFRPGAPDDVKAFAEQVLESTTRYGTPSPEYSAGIFDPRSDFAGNAPGAGAHALEYARYAASSAAWDGQTAVAFDNRVAAAVVYQARKDGEPARGLEDYTMLCKLGVDFAALHNAGGLCALEKSPPDFGQAEVAFELATSRDPGQRVYWANRGYAEFENHDLDGASKSFLRGVDTEQIEAIPVAYLRRAGLAFHHAYTTANESPEPEIIRGILERARQALTETGGQEDRLAAVQVAIDSLTVRSA